MTSTTTDAAEPLAVSPEDAAKMVGLARTALYARLASKEIRSFSAGRRRLIPVSELRAWLARSMAEQAA